MSLRFHIETMRLPCIHETDISPSASKRKSAPSIAPMHDTSICNRHHRIVLLVTPWWRTSDGKCRRLHGCCATGILFPLCRTMLRVICVSCGSTCIAVFSFVTSVLFGCLGKGDRGFTMSFHEGFTGVDAFGGRPWTVNLWAVSTATGMNTTLTLFSRLKMDGVCHLATIPTLVSVPPLVCMPLSSCMVLNAWGHLLFLHTFWQPLTERCFSSCVGNHAVIRSACVPCGLQANRH